MKHKTWFRLVIKAVGVLLICFGLPRLVTVIAYFLIYEIPGNPAWEVRGWIYEVLPHALQVAIGCYLFLDGRWLIEHAIPSNKPYCPECGYEVSQISGIHCPECGTPLPDKTPQPDPRNDRANA